MSLGGLALGIGMLDDCAVVVSENIFRHRTLGKSMKEAAEIGTREVGPAVTAAALTTVVVFLPVIYVHGVAGQLFKDAALTVTFSLISSLVVSLTLLPMLSSHKFGTWHIISLPFKPFLRRTARSFNSGYETFVTVYHRSLVWSLDHKGDRPHRFHHLYGRHDLHRNQDQARAHARA